MKSLCKCGPTCSNPMLGLFLLRVVVGIIFLYHGVMKLQHISEVSSFLLTYHIPAFLTLILSVLEVVGGIGLILGVWTCIFACILAVDMLITIMFVSRSAGFAGNEFGILLLAGLGAIKSTGGGKWKITNKCGCVWGGRKTSHESCQKCGHDSHSTCACECHPK